MTAASYKGNVGGRQSMKEGKEDYFIVEDIKY